VQSINQGKVVLVAGLYCAGKTTLIRAALRGIPEFSYITTYTTRPPRETERDGTHEYVFVSQTEYRRLCQKPGWDHTETRGICYGSDAASVNERVLRGKHFIVVTTMNEQAIASMRAHYAGTTVLLFLNTNVAVCRQRILAPNSGRSEKYLSDPTQTAEYAAKIAASADYVYEPLGPLAADEDGFTRLLRKIISNQY
jgi:guanylate kinase